MEQIERLSDVLARVYGQDQELLVSQIGRYRANLERFVRLYGPGRVLIFRAPGRVNLIGEHTDYNQGYVLPAALDRDVLLLCRPRDDNLIRLQNAEAAYAPRAFRIERDIPPQEVGDWSNYIQGPAQLLAREAGQSLVGMDAFIDGQAPHGIPRGSGLSSSSALTVVAAVAMVRLNELNIAGPALADACGRAEWYVGTRGGIMDQFSAILARREHALFLDCRPRSGTMDYHYEHVPLPSDYAVIVVDSGVRHRNTGPHYNRRVAECRIGIRLLQQDYPELGSLRDAEEMPWETVAALLPETITRQELAQRDIDPDALLESGVATETDLFTIRSRCRHVISENRRVLSAVSSLRRGDMSAFGALMNEAHQSARDDYDISTPEIDALVGIAQQIEGTVGARLTGAGWGGCIVAIVANEMAACFCQRVPRIYEADTRKHAQTFLCRSGPGADLVLETIAHREN